MHATSPAPSSTPASRIAPLRARLPWLLLGGVAAALLELGFAIAYWLPHGVAPTRLMQGVAAWWIGRDAYSGGLASALFGVLLYCHMMIAVVAVYHAASLRYRALLQHPLRYGALYGAMMYVLILEFAVPQFGVHVAVSTDPVWRLACLAAFMLLVGCVSAWSAQRAQRAV